MTTEERAMRLWEGVLRPSDGEKEFLIEAERSINDALAEQASRHAMEKEQAVKEAYEKGRATFADAILEFKVLSQAQQEAAVKEAVAVERCNWEFFKTESLNTITGLEERCRKLEAYRDGEAARIEAAVKEAVAANDAMWKEHYERAAAEGLREFKERDELLRKAVEAARQEEREACAKEAEHESMNCFGEWAVVPQRIIKRIRSCPNASVSERKEEQAADQPTARFRINKFSCGCEGTDSRCPVHFNGVIDPPPAPCSWFTMITSRWGFQVEDVNPWRPQ